MIKFKLPKKNQVALKAGIERELDERRDDVYKIINGMITDIHRDATMRLQQITNEGRLAGGLQMDKPTKQRMYGEVFNDVDYAPFVEFGTKGFTGTDKRGRQISIAPMPERPFMRPALSKYRKQLRRRIDRRVDEALDRVQKL